MSLQELPYILGSQEKLSGRTRSRASSSASTRSRVGSDASGQHRVNPETSAELVAAYTPIPLQPLHVKEETEDEIEESTILQGKFGSEACKPKWTQRLANLNVFVVVYGIAGIWMITLSSLLGSQATSIERHLGITSSQTGLLMSSNEVGYLSAVLVGSHLGKYLHIPRCLSLSGVLFGIFTLFMALGRLEQPRAWMADLAWEVSNSSNSHMQAIGSLCRVDANRHLYPDQAGTPAPEPQNNWSKAALPWAFWLLVVCCMLGGAVKSYRLPLMTYYIEKNNASSEKSGLLIGISFTAMLFGPPIALFLGAYISSIPVDLQDTPMSKLDHRWIGAWWLGFLIVGLCCLLCSLPVMFFPRHIRASSTSSQQPETSVPFRVMLSDLPRSLARMFSRPIFVLALAFACVDSMAFSGWFAFSQKYVEIQFNKTSQEVSTIIGALSLFSVVVGTFMGGYFTTRLKLKVRGCAMVTLAIAVITVLMDSLYLLFGCQNSEVVGLGNKSFDNSSAVAELCGCHDEQTLVVCGDNNVNYLSPCLAGCLNSTQMMFSNCSETRAGLARPGLCPIHCNFFIPYLVVYFCGFFLGTASIVPCVLLSIRAVEQRDQALASGTTSFSQTLIGILPSPIFYGKLIDSACAAWSSSGSCMLYEREALKLWFQGVNIGLRCASLLIMLVVVYLAHRQVRTGASQPRQTPETTTLDAGDNHVVLDKTLV